MRKSPLSLAVGAPGARTVTRALSSRAARPAGRAAAIAPGGVVTWDR
jgi:hypothetical protein